MYNLLSKDLICPLPSPDVRFGQCVLVVSVLHTVCLSHENKTMPVASHRPLPWEGLGAPGTNVGPCVLGPETVVLCVLL